MNKSKYLLLVAVLVVILIFGLNFWRETVPEVPASNSPAVIDSTGVPEYDPELLAKALKSEAMVLYGTFWSEETKRQTELFDEFASIIDYVECDRTGANSNPDECTALGIENYPTWIYEGNKYSGFQSLADLAKIVDFDSKTGR